MLKKSMLLLSLCLALFASACQDQTAVPVSTKSSTQQSATERLTKVPSTTPSRSFTTSTTKETEPSSAQTTVSRPRNQTTTASAQAASATSRKKTTASKAPASGSAAKETGVFTVNGQKLTVGMKVTDSLIRALGSPDDIQEAPSCHFDGNDTIYIFADYSLYTYVAGSSKVLYLIELNSPQVSTAAGAKVGMGLDKVKALYGNAYTQLGSSIRYAVSNTVNISFTYQNNIVSMIEYEET